MAKFIDPFTDTGFKIVFGEEDILRQFLNALFEKDPGFNQYSYRFLCSERKLRNATTSLRNGCII